MTRERPLDLIRRAVAGVLAAVLAAASAAVGAPAADVRLASVIGSNMVLQADRPVPIWGWGSAGGQVTVRIAGQSKSAIVSDKGRWQVMLDGMPPRSTPVTMTVEGVSTTAVENVLIGEVWVGAGQSNMQLEMAAANDADAEVSAAQDPEIRLFTVAMGTALRPAEDVQGHWVGCRPDTVRGFSAALYYFGRALHRDLKVPVGLIATTWLGTLIEPWTPLEGLESQPELQWWAEYAKAAGEEGRWVGGKARHESPTALFNAMVSPLAPFAIRGVLWYQGESNVMQGDSGPMYLAKMKGLICGWREVWRQGEFPFLFVQLAPWSGYKDGALPPVWQAQAECLKIPNTGMAVTTDIAGNLDDIHPKDKQDVGQRLALWALATTYGRSGLVCSGPLYKAMDVKDGRAVLTFDYAGGGLKSRDGAELTEFTIAGADKTFAPAQARIDGDTVVVSSAAVATPAAVRFGWRNVATPNLSNAAGLPASPFRTDSW